MHIQPECLVGDVIFVVKVLPHEHFMRNGNDLSMKKEILLIEGLTGVVFNLTHLDGRTYTIESAPNEMIADKSKKVLKGLGMPIFKDPTSYGNLVINFHLIMPEKGSISQNSIQELATVRLSRCRFCRESCRRSQRTTISSCWRTSIQPS